MRIRPALGATIPARSLTSVLLPDPFSPRIACAVPGSNAIDTSSRARVSPYDLLRCSTSSIEPLLLRAWVRRVAVAIALHRLRLLEVGVHQILGHRVRWRDREGRAGRSGHAGGRPLRQIRTHNDRQ